jgi:splicing factor 3B subunit 2
VESSRSENSGEESRQKSLAYLVAPVLPEKNISATGFFGGEHAYDLDAARRDTFGQQRKRKAGEVEVSVDVDQLGEDDKLDKDALKREYESRQRAEAAGQWQSIDQEDLADMIASESRKRTKRDDDRKTRKDDDRKTRR